MKLFFRIALLLAVASPVHAQVSPEAGKQLRDAWFDCVNFSHSVSGDKSSIYSSAESAFRACETEENLYLSAMAASFRDPESINRLRYMHYKDKQAFKTRLNDEAFKEIAKRIGGKQP